METQPNVVVNSAPQTPAPNEKNPYTIMIGVVLLFFVMTAFLLLRAQNKANPSQNTTRVTVTKEISPTIVLGSGSLSLQTQNVGATYNVGSIITLNVIASSDNKPVTGYDAVIKYDPKVVQFVSQKSMNENFQVFVKNKDGKISLTAIKKLGDQAETVFAQTPVVSLTFNVLTSGNAVFTPEFDPSTKKGSNIIDNQNQQVLGRVEGTTVVVK